MAISEGWAMSESLPLGGAALRGRASAQRPGPRAAGSARPGQWAAGRPGAVGVLVATPFAPFRETTPLLRYDTGDLVRTLTAPPTCALRQQPATSDLLGKRRLSIRHESGWVTPRQVLEALEALEVVPLPARCGFWAVPGGSPSRSWCGPPQRRPSGPPAQSRGLGCRLPRYSCLPMPHSSSSRIRSAGIARSPVCLPGPAGVERPHCPVRAGLLPPLPRRDRLGVMHGDRVSIQPRDDSRLNCWQHHW